MSFALLAAPLYAAPSGGHDWKHTWYRQDDGVCKVTAGRLFDSCRLSATEEARVDDAVCLNETDRETRRECTSEAISALRDALHECRDQHAARRELCREPGFGGPYDPEIEPDDFVSGIDNPYAPFRVGSRWVYEKETEDGTERVEIEVLDEPREILGVECTTVRDRVFVDGELVEDTSDWLAQDRDGNVWYFGEISQNFEDGVLHDLDGSWEAGVDGAKPGFWVKAAPEEGELYRQEWLPGEAEDVVEVVDVASEEDVPFDNGMPVLKTRDFTPLEPGKEEFKFYVPGVGLVLELDPESDERLELIEYAP
jgi:hypothetical protein